MEHRIDRRGPIQLTARTIRTSCRDGQNFREIPAFWQAAMGDGTFQALESAMRPESELGLLGVCLGDHDPATGAFTYGIAIETPDDRSQLPPGTIELAIPATTWVRFIARGPLPGSIQDVFRRVHQEWFPTSGYRHAGGPELEIYGPGDGSAPDYVCEVWMAVEPA